MISNIGDKNKAVSNTGRGHEISYWIAILLLFNLAPTESLSGLFIVMIPCVWYVNVLYNNSTNNLITKTPFAIRLLTSEIDNKSTG